MPVFEDIAAADYDESPEVLLEWLETPTGLPEGTDGPPDSAAQDPLSHTRLDMPHTMPSVPSAIHNQLDIVSPQNRHDLHNDSRFRDLMVHAQYIMSLHNKLVNASKDPLNQTQYIEWLAAALLELSIPEAWEDVKDIGKDNAGPLLSIMQNVCPTCNRGAICSTDVFIVARNCILRSPLAASCPVSHGEGGGSESCSTGSTVPSRSRVR
jgi:hypothetical protein